MATPTLDTVRPSWERDLRQRGTIRPNAVNAPSRRWTKRPGAETGEDFILVWDNIDESDYQTILATYEQVGTNKVVAFTPPDEVSARGWRILNISPATLSGQNYRVGVTLRSLPGSVII